MYIIHNIVTAYTKKLQKEAVAEVIQHTKERKLAGVTDTESFAPANTFLSLTSRPAFLTKLILFSRNIT